MASREPPLHAVHADRGASFTEFGGWDMPVEFDSIRAEHEAVRESAGIFDVSHMGEIEVTGPDARTLMQRLTTNDVAELDSGEGQYACITDADGTILDDTVVYNLPPERDADYLFVPNAGHDAEMYDRWVAHREEWGLDATVENRTDEYAMFALQGPDAETLLGEAVPEDERRQVRRFSRFGAMTLTVAGVDCLVARTGYTGEDGFELLVPWGEAATVWTAFTDGGGADGDTETDGEENGSAAMDAGAAGVQPCGLGARDTLRIEAGFLLSGQDFDPADEPRTPYEAGIGFVVKLDHEFVGRDALEAVDAEGTEEQFVGFRLVERGVPRHGYDITGTEGRVIGTVTSGTMSPTLGEPIGMGYVPAEYADPGTTIRVVVRGQQKKARVRTLPFLDD
jgi:aminomethyltransferase